MFLFKKNPQLSEPQEERITQEEKLPLSQTETVVNGASFCSNLQIAEWKQN